MSVTLANVLKLPSFREAAVAGGKSGLKKTVSSVSVLEYTMVDDVQEYMFSQIEFLGNELVISCFGGIRNDVDAQCTLLQRLADAGEVGLVLYYVGVILPGIDRCLIELADKLDFPLIVMPERRPNLRYSDVIIEVMDAVFKDRMTGTYFQTEILEHISRMPVYQHNIRTAMRLLSDRVRASLFLIDASGELLESVCCPRSFEIDFPVFLARYKKLSPSKDIELDGQRLFIKTFTVTTNTASCLELYLIKPNEEIRQSDGEQIIEVLQICLRLWNQKYGEAVLPELVQAILQDEPLRMRRIANAFTIDIASIHTMLIVSPLPETQTRGEQQRLLSLVRDELSAYCKTIITDIYHRDIVVFIDTPPDHPATALAEMLDGEINKDGINALITACFNLNDTGEVRRAWLKNKTALAAARAVYPYKTVFTGQEIGFAELCLSLIARGEEEIRHYTAPLNCLDAEDGQNGELTKTLEVFLLDAESSPENCAKIMYRHPNSIRYRLNRIGELLGFKIGALPETMEVYQAAALRRLLRKSPLPKQVFEPEPV
jgi:sugar diacid utilization regulator